MDKKNKIGMEKRLGYARLIYYTVFLIDEKGQRNEALFTCCWDNDYKDGIIAPGAAILFLIWLGAWLDQDILLIKIPLLIPNLRHLGNH